MKNSVLLRRIITLLLSAVMLSGIISAGIYFFVTQRLYTQARADDLMPIARTIAGMLSDAQQNGAGMRSLWPLLERNNKDFLGATLNIYNANGESIMNPPGDRVKGKEPPPDEADVTEAAAGALTAVLSGKDISEIRKTSEGQDYLVVGVPIQSGDSIIGAVTFTKAVSELKDAMNGMNLTLLISTLAAFLIMLFPGYYWTKRLIGPIRQMENVARAMAKGDFTVRADESQKGEIGELARSMNHFAEESGQLEQTRRDYVSNVSHELRTPIAAIRAMGETLRDGMAKSEEKRELFYNNIVRESLRLSRLVDDLLELSRLQANTEPLKKTRFDLREVIQNVADVYSHVAMEAGLQFAFYVDMDKEIQVFSNPDRIEQILIILLDNAIKHTPEDGVITLSVENKDTLTEIRVSDTGEGIPEEDIPHIFERFYMADKSHSGGGTGLGLSIAHEIIKGLGETIQAESGHNGAVFIFTAHKEEAYT